MADVDRRDYVAQMYPGTGWKRRVAEMPDSQIFAIYTRNQMRKQEEERAAKDAAKKNPNNDTLF